MFTDSRSIDDRATAASFDTALQKYAAATDSWFDGTPFSVDTRLAQCRRLMNVARTHVARRGAQAGPLSRLAELESDARALIALREDLLTGAFDREDTSRIAGVYVAASDDDDDRDIDFASLKLPDVPKHQNNEKAPSRFDDENENDYLFDEMGRYRRERFKGKEANCGDDEEFADGEHGDEKPAPTITSMNGASVDELLNILNHQMRYKRAADHRMDEFDGSGRPATNPYTGDDQGSFSGNPEGRGHWDKPEKKESSLSPQDRRFVTLESSRFLADNTDTNDARELATRAMHFAQRATSTYDVNRSRLVTSAFVQKVADGAAQRGQHVAALKRTAGRQSPAPNTDGLPPEALFL